MVIYAVAMITAFIRPYDGLESELLQALELLSLTAIFFTVWAGVVFLEYPKCEKGLDPITGRIVTYHWCDTISILAGILDVAAIVIFVYTYTRMKIGSENILSMIRCCQTKKKKMSSHISQIIHRQSNANMNDVEDEEDEDDESVSEISQDGTKNIRRLRNKRRTFSVFYAKQQAAELRAQVEEIEKEIEKEKQLNEETKIMKGGKLEEQKQWREEKHRRDSMRKLVHDSVEGEERLPPLPPRLEAKYLTNPLSGLELPPIESGTSLSRTAVRNPVHDFVDDSLPPLPPRLEAMKKPSKRHMRSRTSSSIKPLTEKQKKDRRRRTLLQNRAGTGSVSQVGNNLLDIC